MMKKGNILHFPVDNYYLEGEREALFLRARGEISPYAYDPSEHPAALRLHAPTHSGARTSEDMLDMPGMRDELRRPMMLLVAASKA